MATVVIYYNEVNLRLDFCKSRRMTLQVTESAARDWYLTEIEALFRSRVKHRIQKDSTVRIRRIIIGGAYITAN